MEEKKRLCVCVRTRHQATRYYRSWLMGRSRWRESFVDIGTTTLPCSRTRGGASIHKCVVVAEIAGGNGASVKLALTLGRAESINHN